MAHERDPITEAFELFDIDNDGYLLVSEAASAVRALGHILTDYDMRVLLQRVGVESRGRIDLNKFRQMHSMIPSQDYNNLLQEAFKTVDKDGSGVIMASELRHLLTNMGDKLTVDDFNTLLEEVDVDSTGRIQCKDLLRAMAAR